MGIVNYFKKIKLEYLITLLIGMTFFFIPFVKFIPELSGYLLILCLFLKNKKQGLNFLVNNESKYFFYLFMFYYFWISLNLVFNYSDYNVLILQKYSGFLFLPFVFAFIKVNIKKINIPFFLFCYLGALTILGTYCISKSISCKRMLYYVEFSYFHPAWLSMCCSIGLAFVIYLWNTLKKNRWVVIFLIYSMIIYLLCLYFSMSRAGIFSMSVVLFFGVIFYLTKMKKIIAFTIFIPLVIVFNTGMTNYRNFSLTKDNTRTILFSTAVKASLSEPRIFFLGVGPTKATIVFNKYLKSTNISDDVKQANNYNTHNIFLNELLKYGVFAFLIWILLFMLAIIKGIMKRNFLLLTITMIFLIHFSLDAYILWYRIGIFSFAFLFCFFIFFFRKEENYIVE